MCVQWTHVIRIQPHPLLLIGLQGVARHIRRAQSRLLVWIIFNIDAARGHIGYNSSCGCGSHCRLRNRCRGRCCGCCCDLYGNLRCLIWQLFGGQFTEENGYGDCDDCEECAHEAARDLSTFASLPCARSAARVQPAGCCSCMGCWHGCWATAQTVGRSKIHGSGDRKHIMYIWWR